MCAALKITYSATKGGQRNGGCQLSQSKPSLAFIPSINLPPRPSLLSFAPSLSLKKHQLFNRELCGLRGQTQTGNYTRVAADLKHREAAAMYHQADITEISLLERLTHTHTSKHTVFIHLSLSLSLLFTHTVAGRGSSSRADEGRGRINNGGLGGLEYRWTDPAKLLSVQTQTHRWTDR